MAYSSDSLFRITYLCGESCPAFGSLCCSQVLLITVCSR